MSAQITIDPLPIPTSDDTVVRVVALAEFDVEIGPAGVDQTWDWIVNAANTVNTVITTHDSDTLFANANYKFSTAGAFDMFYEIASDEWHLRGMVGADPFGFGIVTSARYNDPLIELDAPLDYLDSRSQLSQLKTNIPIESIPDTLLNLLPLVPDSLRVIVDIERDTEVDAAGLLTINTSTWSVLRQKRTDHRTVRIEAKLSILPWTDVTGTVLSFLPFEVPTRDTVMSYRYHAQGEGIPVAEVFVAQNDSIERVEYTMEPLTAGIRDLVLPSASVFPNPTSGAFEVQTSDVPLTAVNFLVLDVLGRPADIIVEPISGSRIRITLDGAAGLYVLRAMDADGRAVLKDQLVYLSGK